MDSLMHKLPNVQHGGLPPPLPPHVCRTCTMHTWLTLRMTASSVALRSMVRRARICSDSVGCTCGEVCRRAWPSLLSQCCCGCAAILFALGTLRMDASECTSSCCG